VGDNLFSECLLLCLKHKDYDTLEIFNRAVQKMINGELLQLYKSRKLNLDEQVYYKIINGKTASFIAAACAAGASSTMNDRILVEKLHLFGEKVGIAFQIKDDLLDYSDMDIGKPTGNDIREKKLTLPLIFTLNTCNPALKKKLIHIIRHKNDIENVNFIIREVYTAGGINYAQDKMIFYRDEALRILYEFPDSEYRSALEDLVRYTTDRTY
jgi:octaprenyl-diphosphate synthase